MKSLALFRHSILPGFLLLLLALTTACNRKALVHHEYMYVSTVETSLRDRVAMLYNKVGTVHNGDRVEVLEKQRRFLRVRTDNGQEGWIEERSLVPQDIYDQFQKLSAENAGTPVQARGTTRAELNMHVTPSREAEHLYQLKDGEKVDVLRRATAEKNAPRQAKAVTVTQSKPGEKQKKSAKSAARPSPSSASTTPSTSGKAAPSEPAASVKPVGSAPEPEQPPAPPPIMEDWYLVRDGSGHVGWVLLRMIDLDIPLDIAQYAEGQRIIGYFVLNTVEEEGKQEAQYLVLLNEPRDGLPWDYNQIRIFTRNRARHRYETAYREHNLEGYLPVKVGHQDFGKEGNLPTFTIRKKDYAGRMVDATYKLNGPIVRRVLTPEEEAQEKANRQAALEARWKERAAYRAQHPQATAAHKRHKHQ